MNNNGVINASGDLLRSGFTDFSNSIQPGQSQRTDVPFPSFTKLDSDNEQYHRWDGSSWNIIDKTIQELSQQRQTHIEAVSGVIIQQIITKAFDVPLNSDRRSATLTSIRNQPALKFLDAGGSPNANDSAEWAFKAPPPPGASGFNLSLVWVPENTATGFVKWRITIDTFKEGVALNSLPTVTENFDTDNKSYTSEVVVKELLKFNHDVRKHYKLRLQRRDGPDTLSTDVFVLGLSLRYF